MFEFVLLDSHQCNRFLGEPAMSNFYPRLPRKSRLKLCKEAGSRLCNQTVNGYRGCIERVTQEGINGAGSGGAARARLRRAPTGKRDLCAQSSYCRMKLRLNGGR